MRGALDVVSRYAITTESIYGGAVPIEAAEEEEVEGGAVAESEAAAASEQSWIAIRMVDGLGDPARGLKYRITLPDGGTKEGTLDEQGLARVASAASGSCTIDFPDLDSGDWDRA